MFLKAIEKFCWFILMCVPFDCFALDNSTCETHAPAAMIYQNENHPVKHVAPREKSTITCAVPVSLPSIGPGTLSEPLTSGVSAAAQATFVVNPKCATVCPGGSVTFNALEGNTPGLTFVGAAPPKTVEGGTVTFSLAPNNTFTYTASAVQPAGGIDTFMYTLSNSAGIQQSASVTITITACCTPFVVNPINATVCAGASVTFDALAGNTGCSLALVRVTQPTFGTVTATDNTFTYTAPAKQPPGGIDTFTYTLASASLVNVTERQTALVTITIENCCTQLVKNQFLLLFDQLILHENS